jgi:hypothetical protein
MASDLFDPNLLAMFRNAFHAAPSTTGRQDRYSPGSGMSISRWSPDPSARDMGNETIGSIEPQTAYGLMNQGGTGNGPGILNSAPAAPSNYDATGWQPGSPPPTGAAPTQGMLAQPDPAAQPSMGLLAQGQQPPSMLNAPPINLDQQPQGDMPAPGAANAGPAMDAPMPTPRPAEFGPSGAQMPGNPMTLQGVQPATPEGMPGGLPQAMPSPAAAPASQAAAPQGGGFLDSIGKLAKGVGQIYGQGGPGDSLINLGLALSQGGLDRMGNISRAQEMTQRSQLMRHTMAMDQQKQGAQNQTAQYLAKARGIPYEQALGMVQSGAANALIAASVKTPQLVDVRNPDGSVGKQWVAQGESSGTTVGSPTPEEKWTPITDQAQRDAIQKGYTGPILRNSNGDIKYPGKAATEVNVDNKGETSEAQEMGKLNAKAVDAMRTAGDNAPAQVSKLNLLERILGGVKTGALADTKAEIARYGKAIGIGDETMKAWAGLDPNLPAAREQATKLINEMTMGMIGPGGFPANNFSDADRNFLSNIFPKISNQPESNQLAIEVLRRVQQRNGEKLQAWDDYSEKQADAGKRPQYEEFERNYRKSVRGKDLFADIKLPTDQPAAQQQTQPSAAQQPPQQDYGRPTWRRVN